MHRFLKIAETLFKRIEVAAVIVWKSQSIEEMRMPVSFGPHFAPIDDNFD